MQEIGSQLKYDLDLNSTHALNPELLLILEIVNLLVGIYNDFLTASVKKRVIKTIHIPLCTLN